MIIVRLEGGLGNQMFQYAIGKSLSIHHNTRLKLDCSLLGVSIPDTVFREYDLDIFKLEVEHSTKQEVNRILQKDYSFIEKQKIKWFYKNIIPYYFKNEYYEREFFKFDSSVFKSRKNSFFIGYWQNVNYFKSISKILRTDFTFKHVPNQKTEVLRTEILQNESVAINVRRTDYITNKNSNDFMGVISMDYYEKAIKYILEKKPNSRFYIFSDDIEWCAKAFKGLRNSFIVDHQYSGHKFSDYLLLMSSCRNFIIPNSTFAWWAVWLNQTKGRIIIQPRRWVNDNSLDTSGLLFEESYLL